MNTRPLHLTPRAERAFTMVEIAISIAIVAFALVAIIGVLPTGLNVQRENREDAIINNDANFFIEALMSGVGSTNLTLLASNMNWLKVVINSAAAVYYTNGQISADQIVGFLSMPDDGGKNSAVGEFRSLSATLQDRQAGTNGVPFTYQVVPLITPAINDYAFTVPANASYANYLTNNLYEVRLQFLWPVIGTSVGSSKLTVRRLVSGVLSNNVPGYVPGSAFFSSGVFFGP